MGCPTKLASDPPHDFDMVASSNQLLFNAKIAASSGCLLVRWCGLRRGPLARLRFREASQRVLLSQMCGPLSCVHDVGEAIKKIGKGVDIRAATSSSIL